VKIRNILLFNFWLLVGLAPNFAQTNCNAAFSANIRCNSVQFTPTFPTPGTKYFWDFGEGNIKTDTSTKQSPSYIYFSADKTGTFQYPVRLIIIAGNCIDTVINTITVSVGNNALPNCSLNSLGLGQVLKAPFLHCNASNINPKFTLRVENISGTASSNASYDIRWGDNQSNTYVPPFDFTSHNYQQMGLYNIEAIVTRQNGCVDSCHYKFFNGRNPAAGLGIPGNADLCVPATVTFDNTAGMLLNPPGTLYYYTVLDCDSVVFLDTIAHTIPLTPFAYTFWKSSCDPMCKVNGQFAVNMTAVNLCGKEDADVTPSLSSTGEARFDMPQQGCAGEVYSVTEKSDSSYYWNANDQKCLNEMFNYWIMRPSTGFSVESGALGDTLSFKPGTDSLRLKFNTPGAYTLCLVYKPGAASPCDPDTILHSICILPKPTARYTKSQSSPCAPATLTLTNVSNTIGNCRLAKYRWEIRFKNSDCGPGGAWALLNGTDTLLERPPQVRFTQPGKYLIRLYVENDCGKDAFLDSLTVASTPTSVIKTIDDACPPHTVNYGIKSSNFCNGSKPSYSWIIPNPVSGQPAITFNGETPPPFVYNQPGTYTVTLQTSSGPSLGCGNSQSTETFIVRPLPAIAVLASNSPVCEGSALTMSVSNPNPNYQYVWSNGQTANSISIPEAKEKDEGTYTVTITDNTFPQKCTRVQTILVVVNQGPSFSVQDRKLCAGESTTLTVAPSNYSNYNWDASPYLNTLTGPTVNVAAPPVGIYRFVVNVMNAASNVCSGRDTVLVTVNRRPIITFSTPDTACVGVLLQLEATPKSNGWSPSNVVSSSGLFSSNTPGFITVNYTHIDSNGCSASRPLNICVQPPPTAGFTTNAVFGCEPLRITINNLSTKPSDVCFGVTYRWRVTFNGADCHSGTGSWNFVSGSDTSFAPVFNFTQSGRYAIKLIVRNGCGISEVIQNISVGTLPEVKLTPIPNACGDTLVSLSAQTKQCDGPTSLSFVWSLDGTSVSTLAQPPVQSIGTGAHALRLTVVNGCGTVSDQISWVVRTVPPAPVLNSNSPVCEGDALSLSVTNSNPAFQYRWSTGVIGATLMIPNATLAAAGTYSVTVIDPSSPDRCNNAQSAVVVVNEKPALTVADKSICLGTSTALNALPANHVDYTWANSPFLESTKGPNVNVKVLPAVGAYTFTVTATGSNGCKKTDTAQVVVNPLPKLTIQTPDTACVGAPLQLQGSGDLMGLGAWGANPGITPQGTYTPAATGFATVVYTFTSDKGCLKDSTVRICAQAHPIANFTTTVAQKCLPLIVSTTDQSSAFAACFGVRYQWAVSFDSAECDSGTGVWNFQSGNLNSTSPVFNITQTGEYRLGLRVSNGCGDSTVTRFVRAGGVPVVKIGRIPDLCGNTSLDPTAVASGCDAYPIGYQWSLDGVVVSTQSSPVGIPISQGPHKLALKVQNDCGAATDSVSFRVLDPPVPSAVLDTSTVCLPNAVVGADNRSTGSNLQYLWSVSPTPPGWGKISNPTAASPTFSFNLIGRYTIVLKVFSAVCDTVRWSQTIKVNAVPNVDLAPISNACNSKIVTPVPIYSLDPSFIDRVTWEFKGSSGIQTSNAFFPTNIPYNTNDTFKVKVSASNRCGTVVDSVFFKVLAQPKANGRLDTTFACLPATIRADASLSAGDERQYQWDIQPAPSGWGRIVTPAQVVSDLVFNQVGRYTLRVKVFNSVCDTAEWSQNLTISAKATVDLLSLADTCEGTVRMNPRPIYRPDSTFIDRIAWRFPGSNQPQISGLFFQQTSSILVRVSLPSSFKQATGVGQAGTVFHSESFLCHKLRQTWIKP